LSARRAILFVVLPLVAGLGFFGSRNFAPLQTFAKPAKPTVTKEPEVFASRTFDPAAPPADMPALSEGENAECDSDFISYASVAGEGRKLDPTHEAVAITKVDVTLELKVTIWVPNGATQHVIDHEGGHRRISEFYYQSADKVAEHVAATYIGRKVTISGDDLQAEFNKLLQQMSAEITDEYDSELNPEPTQLRYDMITDHSRNDVSADDAVSEVLKDVTPASSSNPLNEDFRNFHFLLAKRGFKRPNDGGIEVSARALEDNIARFER